MLVGVVDLLGGTCSPATTMKRMVDRDVQRTGVVSGEMFAFGATRPPVRTGAITVALIGEPSFPGAPERATRDDDTPERRLVSIYERNPHDTASEVRGHFAFALFDAERRRFLIASDRMGVYRLFYRRLGRGSMMVSNRLRPLVTVPGDRPRLSLQSVYSYMYFHMIPTPGTIFDGCFKLPPASELDLRGDDASPRKYWVPSFSESEAHSPGELAEGLRASLATAVDDSAPDSGSCGAFLSGGLDSSTVTGLLATRHPENARSFSIGFQADGYDETPYARAVARHFRTRHHEYFVTPQDVADALPRIAVAYDEPFGNSSALPTYYCARLAAQNGVGLLLAGDGGDELYAGNERYATQALFERYASLPAPLRRWAIESVVSVLPGGATELTRKAKSFVRQANLSLVSRLQEWNFLHQVASDEVFEPDFLSAVDTRHPLALQEAVCAETGDASALNRMLYLDWQFTLADNDLRKVRTMCEEAGVLVRFPMLTDGVVAHSCSVPSGLKLKNRRLRYFYKHAMRGFLPDVVLAKRKHGFGLPFGIWLRDYTPLRELARDALDSLARRGFIREEFVHRAERMHLQEHAAYFGELVWIMMVLELWLAGYEGMQTPDGLTG
jgi:asparagine synthase (glutamine-hydrolysing)